MKAFLKWAGGKSRIASKIKEHLKDGQRLVEPFVGSGALFLSNSFDKYLLCDTNVDLINLYNNLKNNPEELIALTRQNINPVRKKDILKNESSAGAYEILRTGDNIKITILSSGSETSLACDISHKLATENIYSKVISMPCQELFDQQSKNYKKEILNETDLIVSIEASETDYWKKYTGQNGLNFGINNFGKSAPYKEIYNHFNLNVESIVNKIKEKL